VSQKDAVLSIDTSVAPLNQRGYRVNDGLGAPLRENLAATLLYKSGYIKEIYYDKEDIVLCDPCCGSGTVSLADYLTWTLTMNDTNRGCNDCFQYSSRISQANMGILPFTKFFRK
jgi:hypothetical protein